MKVGLELADVRRRMGLTLEEISRRTKISVERLSAIERGDRDNLPALVYLNGFLRAYAAEVNLDGQDVTHRYLEELEQTPQHGAASDAPAAEGGPVLELPVTERPLEEFMSEDVFHVQPAPSDLPHQSAHERGAWREAELANEMASQRESVPSPVFPESKLLLTDVADLDDSEDMVEPVAHAAIVPTAPPARGRYLTLLILLVVGAAVAGFLLSANLDRLPQRPDDSAERRPAAESDAARTSDPGDSVAKPESAAGGQPPAPDTNSSLAHTSVSKPDRAGADNVGAAVESVTPTEKVAEPDNLSGWWNLSNRVESTSYSAFENLNLGYRVQLQQRGDRVSGTGHKWMEDGKPLPANRRTPIVLEGTRTGQRLELTFTEKGARRVSQGTFVMELTADGVLQGRFISDAANSEGSSLARRTTPPSQ